MNYTTIVLGVGQLKTEFTVTKSLDPTATVSSSPLQAIATVPEPTTEVAMVTTGLRRFVAAIELATCTSKVAAAVGTATAAATVSVFVQSLSKSPPQFILSARRALKISNHLFGGNMATTSVPLVIFRVSSQQYV